jgi:penicillin-binding protein 1B
MSRSPKNPKSRRPARRRGRPRKKRTAARRLRLRKLTVRIAALATFVAISWIGWEGLVVYLQFQSRHWDQPARVYAAPMELYAGRKLTPDALVEELETLGYRQASGGKIDGPAWWKQGSTLRVRTRSFRFWDAEQPSLTVQIDFDSAGIRQLRQADGSGLPVLRLDPLEIGSIFPAHGEDRLVLGPGEAPAGLLDALIAIEDRQFYSHHGIDLTSILRAAWANLRAGQIVQGGSTLTQQLVKNYFLDSRRTFGRKVREAVMAIWLDGLYAKEDILTAYVNEIYLGQDGQRAIHGFGLGSRFYFGRPLAELESHELALLVALIRGPSYYNPWRHPERARELRDRILRRLADKGFISAQQSEAGIASPLDVKPAGFRAGYHPAFLDLVRRQLASDYRDDDLTSTGLTVFTTLDSAAQRSAEQALSESIKRLAGQSDARSDMQGAAIVSQVQTGEVLAVVGGRKTGFDGFNRALEASRPIGSLVKPAVYLAAIEEGERNFASIIEDAPLEVPLEDGSSWAPGNFSGEYYGEVTLVRALAESLNLATVRLGMEVGVEQVRSLLQRLGATGDIRAYPSLLLGAVNMTPFEVAGVYATLASGGFRSPLRAVREVIGPTGTPLSRYPIAVQQAADPGDIHQLNRALIQVMRRGTGRSAASRLPRGLVTAGKTGTSDEFRDSWFAGYGGDNLAVVWLGNDDNSPIGLSGGRGALPVWADIMSELGGGDFISPQTSGVVDAWVDYGSGELAARGCGDAILLGLPQQARLPAKACGQERRSLSETVMDWLRHLGN